MTPEQASAAMGTPLVVGEGFSDTDYCHYRLTPSAPGLLFMVEDGRIVRVETTGPNYATPSGVRVGDSERSARRVYAGRAMVQPHKYTPTGHYLVVPTSDSKLAIVVETEDGRVVAIRGGQRPAVEKVEGCS